MVSINEKNSVTTTILNEVVHNPMQDLSPGDITIDSKDLTLTRQANNKKSNLSKKFNSPNKAAQKSFESANDANKKQQTLDRDGGAGKKNEIGNEELNIGMQQQPSANTADNLTSKENDKKIHSGHVGPQLTNTSDIFKPILSFIGIDAPSGTLMDNLFKEFGSLISGNLHIKSVDINILGRQTPSQVNSDSPAANAGSNLDPLKLRSFYNKKSFFKNSSNSDFSSTRPNSSTRSDKLNESARFDESRVITTILSFDSLLFNLNVRQVFSQSQPSNYLKDKAENTAAAKSSEGGEKGAPLSMSNPVYIGSSTKTNEPANSKTLSSYNTPKYFTKIDTGIQLNNLTQEVNMPLLRLIHQVYSIFADAIEYDKEPQQSKIVSKYDSLERSYELQNQYKYGKEQAWVIFLVFD